MENQNREDRIYVGGTVLDKVSRYGWRVIDKPGELRLVNKNALSVNNEVYQRAGINSKVLELASSWSWIACGALVVASRDGLLWVVDGQHRKLAADRRSDIQDLPCIIFHVDDVKDEAKAFILTNTNRRNVSAVDKFRASLAAGDATALKVMDAINIAGLRVTTAANEPRAIKSVALAQKIAESDFDGLLVTLVLCGEMARVEQSPVHARLLGGLYYIHKRVEGGLNNLRLKKRIKQIGISALLTAANKAASYYGTTGGKVCADGMMQAINHGLREKFFFREVVSSAFGDDDE